MHFWLLFFPHAVFDILKGALSQPERTPLGTQKDAFWEPKGIILITNKLQNVFFKTSDGDCFLPIVPVKNAPENGGKA